MSVIGVVVGAIITCTTTCQFVACRKVKSLWQELHEHRQELMSNRKALGISYAHEGRYRERLDEVLSKPSVSDNPKWEIDGCETILKNLPSRRKELNKLIEHHHDEVQKTIRKIRRWKRILLMPGA